MATDRPSGGSMDFFAHQDAARATSRRLILLLGLAVAAMVLLVNLLTAWGLQLATQGRQRHQPPQVERVGPPAGWSLDLKVHLWVTLATLAVIGVGSWLKIQELKGGGATLAVSLGGREVLANAGDRGERRLRNVVEEMAIAAGIPVPAVFVLEEKGINAFAAGHELSDSAIAVTRGCLTQLTRDELQGVVAHEMSHVLNGDARINLRLIGAVHGLLALSEVGWVLVRAGSNSGQRYSSRERNNGLPLIAAGLGLVGVGWLGWLLAELVRAGVSRQREFLADSSAVQFTRNGGAVADALKKVLRPEVGSRVDHPQAAAASHMFFANALSGFGSLFATHPPLPERIKRIDPGWDGRTLPPALPPPEPEQSETAAGGRTGRRGGFNIGGPLGETLGGPLGPLGPLGAAAVLGAGAAAPTRPAAPTRAVDPAQVDFAAELLARLPAPLMRAAGEPYGARAAVLVTMLDGGDAALKRIHALDPALAALTASLQATWRPLDAEKARLPLLHLALPTLRQLTGGQRERFLLAVAEAEAASGDSGQAVAPLVARLVRANLAERRPPPDFQALKPLLPDIVILLGGLARASGEPAQAFAAGWARLLMPGAAPALPEDRGTPALVAALDRLARANGAIRRRVVEAAAHAVAADGKVAAREAELLRLTCECLGLPLPLFRDQRAA